MRDLSEGIQGDLRIESCITAANAFLPQVLGLYRQKYPHVGLALQPGNSAVIVENLRRGEIDIAIVASERLPSDVAVLAKIPDDLVLFAAPNHRFSLRRGLRPEDLSDCDFIQREAPSDTRAMVKRWICGRRHRGSKPDGRVVTRHNQAPGRRWVGNIRSIRRLIADELRQGTLKILRVKDWPLSRKIRVIILAECFISKTM